MKEENLICKTKENYTRLSSHISCGAKKGFLKSKDVSAVDLYLSCLQGPLTHVKFQLH